MEDPTNAILSKKSELSTSAVTHDNAIATNTSFSPPPADSGNSAEVSLCVLFQVAAFLIQYLGQRLRCRPKRRCELTPKANRIRPSQSHRPRRAKHHTFTLGSYKRPSLSLQISSRARCRSRRSRRRSHRNSYAMGSPQWVSLRYSTPNSPQRRPHHLRFPRLQLSPSSHPLILNNAPPIPPPPTRQRRFTRFPRPHFSHVGRISG